MLDLNQFTGYTPGPWQIQVTGGAAECVSGSETGLWATVEGPDYEIRNNNAALIAAAPELLEECKRLRAELVTLRREYSSLLGELESLGVIQK